VGLTRKGKGTKWMLVVEGQGIPVGMMLASAQQAEVQLAPSTLATVRVPQARGRPRTRPRQLVADRGYDSRAFRRSLRQRGIRPCIPPRRQRGRRRPGRPLQEFRTEYASRWIVERTFAWRNNFRRLLVRHERLVGVYHGFMLLAFVLICLARISE
jgi:transposase